MWCLQVARNMLGIATYESLPPKLERKLIEMEAMLKLVGGSVVSRQIVALAIATWADDEEA